MAMSEKERLRRKKMCERKRRARIRKDPEAVAEENRKRRARYVQNAEKRKEKKVTLSTRKVREQRRKWRLAKRRQKVKKQDSNEGKQSSQAISGHKRREKNRVKCYRENKKLCEANQKLRKRATKYKLRYIRLKSKILNSLPESPRSKLNNELIKNREKISPNVKRQLLQGLALSADMQESYSSINSNTEKREFRSKLKLRFTKKYRFMSTAKPFFQLRNESRYNVRKDFGANKKKVTAVRECILEFYEDDETSTQAPGKNDCIGPKQQKKQKRYLNNSLQFLHRKFCETHSFVVSYALFCRLRPFWVIPRKIDGRDTCLCFKHENIELQWQKLKKEGVMKKKKMIEYTTEEGVLKEKEIDLTLDEVLAEEMCCEVPTEKCFFRKCEACSHKLIICEIFDGNKNSHYDEWRQVKETSRDGIEHKKTMKTRVECNLAELVDEFFNRLPDYMAHCERDRHQKKFIRNLKKNLGPTEALIHIDFSENYGCKYFREIQACHFGGNREHVTLHTGVMYVGKERPKSFCTMSSDMNHDAVAILAHLKPILENMPRNITKIHFYSDSPSSQYRNKRTFHIIFHHLIPIFKNLEELTWNYSESGHGKGAADGVGGSIKRTLDRIVASGKDVANLNQLHRHLSERRTDVKIVIITEPRDLVLSENLQMATQVPGTMKVHQIQWNYKNPKCMNFNVLSCFERCQESCEHGYFLRKIVYDNSADNKAKTVETVISLGNDNSSSSVTDTVIQQHEVENTVDDHHPKDCTQNVVTEHDVNKEYSVNDWVIVNYSFGESYEKYIAQILSIEGKESDTSFFVEYTRSKTTRDFNGFIYHFLTFNPDTGYCKESDIVQKVDPPTKFQRAFKFNVHSSSLLK